MLFRETDQDCYGRKEEEGFSRHCVDWCIGYIITGTTWPDEMVEMHQKTGQVAVMRRRIHVHVNMLLALEEKQMLSGLQKKVYSGLWCFHPVSCILKWFWINNEKPSSSQSWLFVMIFPKHYLSTLTCVNITIKWSLNVCFWPTKVTSQLVVGVQTPRPLG